MDLTDAAFKNYANGDYRSKSDGALFNAGSNELYSAYATSATDLYGVQRIQSKIIDIGCYEASSSAGLQIIVMSSAYRIFGCTGIISLPVLNDGSSVPYDLSV